MNWLLDGGARCVCGLGLITGALCTEPEQVPSRRPIGVVRERLEVPRQVRRMEALDGSRDRAVKRPTFADQ